MTLTLPQRMKVVILFIFDIVDINYTSLFSSRVNFIYCVPNYHVQFYDDIP